MAPNTIPGGGLSVIALVSGGKDSFFSVLHCLENGHRLVALANLHPPATSRHGGPGEPSDSTASSATAGTMDNRAEGSDLAPPPGSTDRLTPGRDRGVAEGGGQVFDGGATTAATSREGDKICGSTAEADLNSFMYQTVGHQVIPLYAEATGIPLYRHAISGGALQIERDYHAAAALRGNQAAEGVEEDETESMIPLLQSVMREHPEANALSAGAILSTYQRTRVESVALRLGLTPLAYLWKYPVLPPPLSTNKDEAQLLFDMAAAGLEARVIKVASGGLDESFLWERVASARGVMRLKKAMGRFGSAGMDTGAVIGEGGEFETLVVDGPKRLFKRRVIVPEHARAIVREGGGTAWLSFGTARLEEKGEDEQEEGQVRRPHLLDVRFSSVLETLQTSRQEGIEEPLNTTEEVLVGPIGGSQRDQHSFTLHQCSGVETWAFTGPQTMSTTSKVTIQEETTTLIRNIQNSLSQRSLSTSSILSTVIILRSMADFPAINAVYGSLFPDPNPPSRVTISCGDLLPHLSGNIAIYLTLPSLSPSTTSTPNNNTRDGLHVQSRSYWAPANIGPYSQAITFPVSLLSPVGSCPSSSSSQNGDKRRIVHIAGQIPLVPASMEFLPLQADEGGERGGAGGLEMQLVLSLQHLWRIGVEMGVQWWTSAAVYFPRQQREQQKQQQQQQAEGVVSPPSLSAREKALLAWRIWKEAHEWKVGGGIGDDEDEDGPDLWDRKFNPKYMSYADEAVEGKSGPDLPDYSLFGENEEYDDNEKVGRKGGNPLPYFFAVEVDELPRSAEAEWHAHAGLSGLTTSEEADLVSVSTRRNSTTTTTTTSTTTTTTTKKQEDGEDVREGPLLPPCEVNHCVLMSTVNRDDDEEEDEDDEQQGNKKEKVACLHSVVAIETGPKQTLEEALSQADKALYESLPTTTPNINVTRDKDQDSVTSPPPYLVYVDTEAFGPEEIAATIAAAAAAAARRGRNHQNGVAVVPCKSIYGGGARGVRLSVVVLYRHFLSQRGS